MAHIVTAPAVQVTAGARAHFIERGGILPQGVDEAVLDRLVDEGLIAEYEAPVDATPPAQTLFTQDDVDAAVADAVAAKDAEFEADKKALADERAEFEAAKAADKKPAAPAKAPAKQG